MNPTFTPIFANGLITITIDFWFFGTMFLATGFALLAILLAAIPYTRLAGRCVAPAALIVGFAPKAVVDYYAQEIATFHLYFYGIPFNDLAWLPIVLSVIAILLSWRKLPKKTELPAKPPIISL